MNLATFRQVTNGFARNHHFSLFLSTARSSSSGTPIPSYWCSSMHLPSKSVENIELKFQSGTPPLKIAKSVSYSPWKLSFYSDSRSNIRSFFITWMELINSTKDQTFSTPAAYKMYSNAHAALLTPYNAVAMTYSFKGIYPINLSEIVLQQRDTEITTFDIEFAYDFYTINDRDAIELIKTSDK